MPKILNIAMMNFDINDFNRIGIIGTSLEVLI